MKILAEIFTLVFFKVGSIHFHEKTNIVTAVFSACALSFGQAPTTGHYYCLGTNDIAYGDWVSPWQNPSGTGPYVFDAQGSSYNWTTTNQNTYSCYRFIEDSGGYGCTIKQSNGTYSSGTRGPFYYSTTYCPLDDYIWLLIIPVGAFAFFSLRTEKFKDSQILHIA